MEKKLVEKGWYDFELVKSAWFEPEEKEYWVVADPFGRKHLLDPGHYACYGLAPGKAFRGIVEKLNCQGRTLIEPEHPRYKLGQSYWFAVRALLPAGHGGQDSGPEYALLDEFGQERRAAARCWQTKAPLPARLLCRVDRILRGNFFLTNQHHDHPKLRTGGRYKLKVEAWREVVDERHELVLELTATAPDGCAYRPPLPEEPPLPPPTRVEALLADWRDGLPVWNLLGNMSKKS